MIFSHLMYLRKLNSCVLFESVQNQRKEEIIKTFSMIGESWSSSKEFRKGYRPNVRYEADIEKKYAGFKNWRILCRIWIGDYQQTKASTAWKSGAQSRHLPIALFNFFQTGEHTDLEVLVTGESIRAHKIVLQGMESPVINYLPINSPVCQLVQLCFSKQRAAQSLVQC